MANLVELFDNIVQMQNLNGVPLAAGKLYVYALGRTRLMDSWSDVDGESLNPNPIILDDAGQAHVYVSDDFDYTLVVCDQYNNEIFSLDKYLYSEGSHSHADVAVAPSESIAVSSYHVGETTIYVPYLTGQLGKVYEGIDPIVVNNQVDKISANHVPLGVQDPLYFVQDDEEGCIIGFSGETLPEGTMNESAFGYEDGQITSYNGSAFSAGNSYEAGSYVDIDGNTINVTGLQPAGNYQSAGDYVVHDELSSYATQDWVENQSYMKEYMESAFYPSTSNPSGYLTAHQDISNKLDVSAFSTVSGDFLTAIPSEYVTENTLQSGLSSKLDSTAFSTVSGNFLTAHQSLDGLMSADLLEISDNKITGYNGTAFAGQGGGVTGDYELSAGSGISIVDYPLEQKTVISVTAQGGNPEVEQAVIDNSATWDNVSAKLDTTAFSDVSGTFLTAHQDLSDYQTIAGMTAYQEAGNYLSANALDELSGNWETVTAKQDALSFDYKDTAISSIDNSALYDNSAHARITTLAGRISDLSSNKLDTTAFSDVSGTFLTAHQDISNKLDTTAFSDVSGSFLTAVPDTYLQNTDLTITDGKVTEISGVPLSAGDELPSGVMNTSALEYNAVNEISGYNGSAIAQYGAEKQFIVHDDTLVHLSNSAQYALGVNLSAVSQLLGVDETVLWSGETLVTTSQNIINLSESMHNFNSIKIYDRSFSNNQTDAYATTITEVSMLPSAQEIGTSDTWVDFYQMTASGSHYFGRNYYSGNTDGTKLVTLGSYIKSVNSTAAYSYRGVGKIFKIVGVHRISG